MKVLFCGDELIGDFVMVGGLTGAVGNLICSICYEDLKPVIENHQAIPVCGQVFHEVWSTFLVKYFHIHSFCFMGTLEMFVREYAYLVLYDS